MADTAPLNADHLAAYFALMEVGSLLQHAVEQQLRTDGHQRMTDLADQVVYSRSGLTYQVGQLEKAALVTRCPSVDDERSTTVTITAAGWALLERVLPGHIDVVRQRLLTPLSHPDIMALTSVLNRVRDHMRAAPPRSAAPRRRRGSGHAKPDVH